MHAELRKLFTTRAAAGLLLGALAVVLLSAVSTTGGADPASVQRPLHTQQLFLLASINIGLFALILGARSFTDEFRHGTIVWTLLSVRERWRVVGAKAAVSSCAAAVIAAIALVVMTAAAAAVASTKGTTVGLTSGDAAAAAGLVAAAAGWASLGAAVGAIVRHQVAAIVGSVIWVFVVENLAVGFLGDVGRLLPGQAAHAIANATAATGLLSEPAGAAVLAVYVAVLGGVAVATLARREVALGD